MHDQTPKVYSYLRFSEYRQSEGASSDRQKAYAEKWAAEHGLQLDSELSMRDEGLSAYHQKHITQGAFGVFLKAVQDGQVAKGSVLVVEGLDRLSRAEPLQAQAQLASIIHAGISVVTPSDNKVYSRESLKANPMDLVYSLLVMIRAFEESDTKSSRVRDAIRRLCRRWQEGTYRGLIRAGEAPGWVEVVNGKWQFVPERAQAVRMAVELSLRGMGTTRIAQELHAAGLSPGGVTPHSGQIRHILKHVALKGEKHLTIEEETFVLEGYYPAILEPEAWDKLQGLLTQRGRKAVRGEMPSVLTGIGVTVCGYCGSPMKAQNSTCRRRPDGTMSDGDRRLQCVRATSGERCPVPGSCSSGPIERALMNFCSDMMNLQSLYEGDRSAVPRAALATAQAKLSSIDTRLQRVTDALMDDDGPAPAVFKKRARELEEQREAALAEVRHAELALAEAARADITGADERWRALAQGVEALDYEARMKARQLVADTFERIIVHHKGKRPKNAPQGIIDLLLIAKGGNEGMTLRIDKKGNWEAGAAISLLSGLAVAE